MDGSSPGREGGWNFSDFRVFGPTAFAGIGRLRPALASRTVPIELRPRLPEEVIRQKFEDELWSETHDLRHHLSNWGPDAIDNLAAMRGIPLPAELGNRTAEIWQPLLAIADTAGGDWPERARAAAVALDASHPDELHDRVRLLADILLVFEIGNADRIHTADLIEKLAGIEESPWRGRWWDTFTQAPRSDAPASLARILHDYNIRPVEAFHLGNVRARGYKRAQFNDAWRRYLPARTAVSAVFPVSSESRHQAEQHGQHNQHGTSNPSRPTTTDAASGQAGQPRQSQTRLAMRGRSSSAPAASPGGPRWTHARLA